MPSAADRMKAPPPANTPRLDLFVKAITQLAQQHGVKDLVIVGIDPQTGESRLYAADATLVALAPLIREKLDAKVFIGETGWGDA